MRISDVERDQVAEVLPETDVLVMVLPSEPSTQKILNAQMLSLLPKRALICNVGRGATVDEAALVEALDRGQIAGAALDVVATEPLPPDSPLWDAPNLLITPHVAGFRAHGGDELVGGNLAAFLEGRPLRNVVPR